MRRAWMATTLVFVSSALAAVGCYVPADTASHLVKSVAVDRDQGAVITVSAAESPELAGTSLTIEPGALAADTTITLELGLDAIVDGEAVAAGPVAIFGPPGTAFSKPALMKLPVTLSAAQDERDLFIQVLEESGERAILPRELLAVESGAVAFRVAGFTSFQPGTSNQLPQDGGHADAGTHPDAGTACTSNAHCPPSDLCINGFCKTCTGGACSGMCTSNAHCSTGRVCVGGQCVLQSLLDGGHADAGHADAGPGVVSCDPILQNCNAAGQYCYFDAQAFFPHGFCAANTGTQDRGKACQTQTDCFTTSPTSKALYCAELNQGGSGVCRDFCDVTVPNNASCAQVPVPQTCVPILPGTSAPGYCDPV